MAKLNEIKSKLHAAGLHPDKLGIRGRDGAVVYRRSYFYRHGGGPEKIAEVILKAIPEATILETHDEWAAWPKTSYFMVAFKVPEPPRPEPRAKANAGLGSDLIEIKECKIHDMDREDNRKGKRPRVYFFIEGENILQNLQDRFSRPHQEYRKLLPEVYRQAGIDQENPTATWSQKAGCSCGCSPGFILDVSHSVFPKEIFVTITGKGQIEAAKAPEPAQEAAQEPAVSPIPGEAAQAPAAAA